MSKGEHTAVLEKVFSFEKNAHVWSIRCECGWRLDVPSREAARGAHRAHKSGVEYQAPPKVERVSGTAFNKKMAIEILTEEGPLRSEEVRRAFFRRGKDLSEPTVRKLLHLMVEEGAVESREFSSKRSKRTVLYFMQGVSEERLAEKVRTFDRLPSGFAFGHSF